MKSFFGFIKIYSKNKMSIKINKRKIIELYSEPTDDSSVEEDSEDELENVCQQMKTKSGYLLDDFVVDDSEEEEETYETDEELLSDEELVDSSDDSDQEE